MILIYKFFIKTESGRVYVEVEGEGKDSEWVYLKSGKIPRHLIDGEILEEWALSVDSQPSPGVNSWDAHIQRLESY